MRYGILGTGVVGTTIATKLIHLGHEVMMGSRTSTNEKALAWAAANGEKASSGTFADASAFGEIIFNCTKGSFSLEALRLAGKNNLDGKILVDLSNPLDFSKGMPPTLIPELSNTTSVGEEIQKLFPETKVVKTLNTVNCSLMVNPSLVSGEHEIFICGNDAGAKSQVTGFLKNSFGWESVIDLGDISASRATEMVLPLWVRLYGLYQSANFNFHMAR